jgi:putative heme transporter
LSSRLALRARLCAMTTKWVRKCASCWQNRDAIGCAAHGSWTIALARNLRLSAAGGALANPDHRVTRRVDITGKSLLRVILALAGCWLLIQLAPVVLVAVVALFLVGTLNPGVEWLERRRIGRSWGIALVFGSLLLLGALLAALTLPALIAQARDVIEHEPELRNKLADLLAKSHALAALAQSLRHVEYGSLAKASAGTALVASTRVFEFMGYLLSSVFLALYIMIDRDRLRGALFALVPRNYHIRLSRVLINLEVIVGGYIRGQALTSALMAVFTFILLVGCSVPNPLAIAVFAGLADVLPYIGAVLSVLPAAAAAATQGLVTTLVVVAAMLAYEELESRFLVPRIYGKTLRLPSSMVLLALLAGGTLMGIVGALMALPLAAAIRMLVEELRVELPGESSDDAPQRASDARAEQEYAERSEGMPAEQAAAIAVEISEERRQVADTAAARDGT